MSDLNDLLAKLPEIRERAKFAAYYEYSEEGNINLASEDLDTLLELVDRQFATIDRLLNDHEPHIAALEKRLAETEMKREAGAAAPDQPRIARYAVDQRYHDGTSGSTHLLAGFDTENEAVKFALGMTTDGAKFYLAVHDRERKRDVFIIGNGFTTGEDPVAVADKPDLPMKWWHLPEFGPFMELDTEGQRDNSYGPFDTREEAQADWLKVISSPPPGESESNS